MLELQSYGNPPSIVSDPSTINLTILANDNPHGVFIFGNEADSPRLQAIGKQFLIRLILVTN